MKENKARSIPIWTYVIVVFGIVLMTVGALVSKFHPTLLTNGHVVPSDIRIYTDYMFSRSIALAAITLFLLVISARRLLAAFMVVLALIQFIDLIDDAGRGDFILMPGILVLVVLFLIAARQLLGGALWQISAWRE